MTFRSALGRARLALIGLVAIASLGCSADEQETADGNGRAIVENHTAPDGRVVRAGLGDITYQTNLYGEKQGPGLVIEVTSDDGQSSTTFPLPEITEELQMLGSFGGDIGHVQVFAAPAGTVLTVRYHSGDEHELGVGADGLAVVVVPSVDALDGVVATGPDGTQCRFRGPSTGIDCVPV